MILPNRITIYVPHPPDKPDHYTLPAKVAELLTDAAGGATITQGTGYWKNDEGELILEPVALVMCAFTGPIAREAVGKAALTAINMLVAAGEQSIAIDVGGTLYLTFDDIDVTGAIQAIYRQGNP